MSVEIKKKNYYIQKKILIQLLIRGHMYLILVNLHLIHMKSCVHMAQQKLLPSKQTLLGGNLVQRWCCHLFNLLINVLLQWKGTEPTLKTRHFLFFPPSTFNHKIVSSISSIGPATKVCNNMVSLSPLYLACMRIKISQLKSN